MNKYRLSMIVEDEATGQTHYEAYLRFRERFKEGFYGPRQEDVTFVEEVPEEPKLPSEEPSTSAGAEQ